MLLILSIALLLAAGALAALAIVPPEEKTEDIPYRLGGRN